RFLGGRRPTREFDCRFVAGATAWMQAITILENEYMVAWDRVTRADVLRAIKEYDRLRPERFFSEHGFAPTTTYELAWEKHCYPPKAILGTAYEFATGQRVGCQALEGGEDRRRKGARTARIHRRGETTANQVKRLFVMNEAFLDIVEFEVCGPRLMPARCRCRRASAHPMFSWNTEAMSATL